MKKYTCERCGTQTAEAFYNRTYWFNGAPVIEVLCKECILKIGKEDGEEEPNEEPSSE